MTRNLKVERLYNLGQFINIKIISEYNEVPEDIANSPEKLQLLFRQLGAECDLGYREYKQLNEQLVAEAKETQKDLKELLEEERDRIAQELEAGEAGDK